MHRIHMKPTKVCIIAKYLYPFDTRLCQQVHTLEEQGIPCDVICCYTEGQSRTEHLQYTTIHRVAEKSVTQGSFITYLLATFQFISATFFKLLSISLKNSYRAIVVHTLPEFLVFITFINKLLGSRIILDGRDLTVDLLDSRWSSKKVKAVKYIAKFLEKIIVSFCDHVITASNGFRRSLIQRGIKGSKVTVLINTADISIFKYDENRTFSTITSNARFIYHGTVSERFGIFVAVKAMETVSKRIPGSILKIHGWYDLGYRRKMEQYISDKQLQKAIIFGDPLPLQEIYKVIMTTDIGIVPYLSDNFMNIALSTKSFEYIASGIPVVASRLKSGEELFNDECIQYSEPGNPKSLAENIITMCLNPDLRAQKRKTAYSTFNQNYTSIIQNRNYLQIIASSLDIEDLIIDSTPVNSVEPLEQPSLV